MIKTRWGCKCSRLHLHLRVLFLGEDRNARWLKDGDLNQTAVSLHRLPIIKGYDKKLGRDNRPCQLHTKFKHPKTILQHSTHIVYCNLYYGVPGSFFFVDMFGILIKADGKK